jgi:hypothetical protein
MGTTLCAKPERYRYATLSLGVPFALIMQAPFLVSSIGSVGSSLKA